MRFLIQQQFDDVLVCQDKDLVERKLPVLPKNLAEDLETHRRRGHNKSAAVTIWTVFAQNVLQTFARPFSGHLDETER